MALLEIDGVSVRFGGVMALDEVSFGVEEGSVCALIGPNGAGKTTLFNVISRFQRPRAGAVRVDGTDLLGVRADRVAAHRIGRTFQNLALWPGLSVLGNVRVGAHTRGRAGFLAAVARFPAAREERRLTGESMEILELLDLADLADRPCTGLPLGTLKRIELARALASRPRLLLLDEPANGLAHEEVSKLGELITRLRSERQLTVLLVEHHMAMVMEISENVVVLDFGQCIAQGSPAEVSRDPKVIEAYLGSAA